MLISRAKIETQTNILKIVFVGLFIVSAVLIFFERTNSVALDDVAQNSVVQGDQIQRSYTITEYQAVINQSINLLIDILHRKRQGIAVHNYEIDIVKQELLGTRVPVVYAQFHSTILELANTMHYGEHIDLSALLSELKAHERTF
jgi:hypothetical protein